MPKVTTSAEAKRAIQRLTPHQQEVLGWIAMNEDGGHHPKTLQVLERLGLIVAEPQVLGGRLPVRVTRYSTPIFVHLAYCAWASTQVAQEEEGW